MCEWARVAAKLGMPPPATIQNAYSLLCRSFEGDLAEASHRWAMCLGPWTLDPGPWTLDRRPWTVNRRPWTLDTDTMPTRHLPAQACSPRHHNVGLLPWSILCGGLLSGKYRPGEAAGAEARFVK